MHTFSGHKFDWRWEVCEVLSLQLVERWPIMHTHIDFKVLSKDGDLRDVNMDFLRRALENKPDDLPCIELMLHCVANVSQAQGHNARWLRG